MTNLGNPSIKLPFLTRRIVGTPWGLVLLTLPIPVVGLLLDKFLYCTAFERSGAVLVCVAITCVYLNHFVVKDMDKWEGIRQGTWKLGRSAEEIFPKLSSKIDRPTRVQISHQLVENVKSANKELEQMNKIKDYIVGVEFIAGIGGTFIWGFGDLWDSLI